MLLNLVPFSKCIPLQNFYTKYILNSNYKSQKELESETKIWFNSSQTVKLLLVENNFRSSFMSFEIILNFAHNFLFLFISFFLIQFKFLDELNLKDFECLNAIVEQTEYDNQTVWRYLCEKKNYYNDTYH